MRRYRLPVFFILFLFIVDVAFIAYESSLLWRGSNGRTFVIALAQAQEGIVVFEDKAGTSVVTDIDWGRLHSGGSKTVVLYVKNVGSRVSYLTMKTADWSSVEAEQDLTLTWNYTGGRIAVDEIIPVAVTLKVRSGVFDEYDFGMDIELTIAGWREPKRHGMVILAGGLVRGTMWRADYNMLVVTFDDKPNDRLIPKDGKGVLFVDVENVEGPDFSRTYNVFRKVDYFVLYAPVEMLNELSSVTVTFNGIDLEFRVWILVPARE